MTTPNLALPELAASQAQKHVTVNEALNALDALVQLAVLDRDLAAPPPAPAEGQRWLVAAGATGAWAGHDNEIAAWQDGAWTFFSPNVGWLAYVVDEGALLAFTGSGWVDAIAALMSLNNMTLLGIGTTADATNPFSAKLNNALWTAKAAAEGGTGDLRYKMSKESAADTLSILLQTAFSGRAELGLTGDDDFHLKVSGDGAAWTEALAVDRTSGGIRFLAHSTDVASATTCDIGAAPSLKVRITGSATISSFGAAAHAVKLVRFAGALTLTHNAASLILPAGGGNIVTAADDTCIAVSDSAGNWRVLAYTRASGVPLAMPASTADNQVLRSDGAGGAVQGSALTLGDGGELSGVGGARKGVSAIADDGVLAIALPAGALSAIVEFCPGTLPGATTPVFTVFAKVSASPSVALVQVNEGGAPLSAATNINLTTGALTGTTGADGKITVSAHTDGKVYVENRIGANRFYAYRIGAYYS
jgi:hypothetical protein